MTEFGPEYWERVNQAYEDATSSAPQEVPITFHVQSPLSISVSHTESTESMNSLSLYADLFARAVEGEIQIWSAESLRRPNHAQEELQQAQEGYFNTFTPEAEAYLNSNPTATVIVAVEAKNQPVITNSMSETEKRKAQREAGKKDVKDLTDELTAAQQDDETIVFRPRVRDSSVRVTARSGFIRSLAQRPDVTEIYMPLNKPRR